MNPSFFRSVAEFRRWLKANHAQATELWVGFYRKDSGKGGVTYSEALDEALCFGWIDGIRKRVDSLSYTNRFTPRKPRSIWSRINIARAEELIRQDRMHAVGLKAFRARDPERCGVYSFENRPQELGPELERSFRAAEAAWSFFQAQPASYRRMACWWVMSAKQEPTRERRLKRLIADSEHGLRLGVIAGRESLV